jgi:hypothetical protein
MAAVAADRKMLPSGSGAWLHMRADYRQLSVVSSQLSVLVRVTLQT